MLSRCPVNNDKPVDSREAVDRLALPGAADLRLSRTVAAILEALPAKDRELLEGALGFRDGTPDRSVEIPVELLRSLRYQPARQRTTTS